MSTPVEHPPVPARAPLAARRGLAVLGAVAAPVAVWWLAGPPAGIAITANAGGGPTPVGPIAVVMAALVAGLAGWGLLAILERTVRCARTAWTWIAVVTLVLSLAGPITSSTSGPAGTLVLVAMHLTTGAVLIGLLPAHPATTTFAHPPRTRIQRAVHRAPITLYRWGLGGLLGGRFVLLIHTGRRTGAPRQVVLEVVGRHGDGYLVASGYGPRAQWYRNVLADPHVRFQVGRHRYVGEARPLPPVESGRRLADYALRHPRTAAMLMRTVGQDVDGSPASYRRVGADTGNGVPIVALRADRRWIAGST